MTFAIVESNSAGMTSPSATPVSTRTPGPVGRRSRAIRPGAGTKPRAGSSALRRASTAWPVGRGRLAFQPPAGRDVELKLDEVEAGDRLRDRVLVLQARVDLHEREGLGRRLVEELDRAGAAVAGAQRQAPRRVQDLALLLGRERRARRLLDDLLVAAPVRAIAQADRPRAAAAVGDDLHLDVARGRHELLEQHGAVAEGLAWPRTARRRTRPEASRARRRGGCRARRPPPSP